MLVPSVFENSFFDDFFDDLMTPFPHRQAQAPQRIAVMRTDVKDLDNAYELSIDLPGFTKEDVKIQLKEGHLTISAQKTESKDEKNDAGKYIRRERYTGAMSRTFYVGKGITEEDIHAKFENGILMIDFPKEAPKKIEEEKYITIE